MKWCIISIIFIISSARGSELFNLENLQVDPICLPELTKVVEDLTQCFDLERFDSNIVKTEIYQTILQYDGDEEAVRKFSKKYCDFGYDLYSCMPIFLNITTPCQPIKSEVVYTIVRGIKKSLDYTCDNNAETFVQLVINNGIVTLLTNMESAGECSPKMDTKVESLAQFEDNILTEYCEKLKEALACHKAWIEPTGNVHLMNYINGSFTVTIEDLGCL